MRRKELLKLIAVFLSCVMLMPLFCQLVTYAEVSLADEGSTYIYEANFDDGSIPMNLSGTGPDRITNVAASGRTGNALQFHMRGNNSGARSVYLYDDRAQEINVPAISYASYDFVAIEFDFYIAAGATGCFALGGSRDYTVKVNGTRGGTTVTNAAANEETPEFLRIDFRDSASTGTFHGGQSGNSQTATINKEQWYTVTAIVDMKNCKVIGYLEGEKVFENTLYVTSWNSSAKATQQVVNPTNLQIPAKGLAFFPPYEYRRTNTEGKIQVDNFKIFEYVEKINDTLVDADFNEMTLGATGATEESVNPLSQKGQTTVVERDAASGDKALRVPLATSDAEEEEQFLYAANFDDGAIPMNLSGTAVDRITSVTASGRDGKALQFHMRGNNSGARSVYLYDDKAQELMTPALSYDTYHQIEIDFDFYIASGATGCFAFGGGTGYPMKADGTLGGTAKKGMAANDETPEFCRIDFRDASVAGTFHGGRSGSSQAAVVNREQWYTVTLVIDMANCVVTGYLDGEEVFENSIYITSWNSSSRVTQQVENPKNLQIPATALSFYPPYEYRRTNTEGKIQIDNFKISEYVETEENANENEIPALKIPELSYTKYDKAVFDLDAFIEEDSDGSFSICYNNEAPELLRLQFTADSDIATLSSNGTSSAAAVKKGEWNRICAVLDLKNGTVTGYLNGTQVISASTSLENLTLVENALCFVGVDESASGVGALLIDNVNVYGMNSAALSKMTVQIPDVDANGNLLNYVVYGEKKIGNATKFFAPTKDVCKPVYFNFSEYEGLITTVDAASIRLNAPTAESALKTTSGIRFATQINDVELFDALMGMQEKGEVESIYFGTLIAPTDYLTVNTLTKGLGEGRYLDVKADYGRYFDFDNDSETTHFVGSIMNVYTANLGRKFAARGYVEITLLSGRVLTIYGDIVKRSIKQVAMGVLSNENYTWSDTEYEQLERYSKVPSWMEEELDPTKQKLLNDVNIITGSTEAEIYAGEELSAYLAKKGIETCEGGYPVVLSIDENLGDDSYRIEATLGENEGMTITGGNGRGVLYGVYAFLEDNAGFHFYTPEIETCDDRNVIVSAGVMDEYTPVFDQRRSSWYTVADSTEQLQSFYAKNRVNGNVSIEKMGGGMSYAPGMFVHTFNKLMETGNEWSANPCLTDPANLEKTISNVKKILAENPTSNIISVSQNDSTVYCTCANCAAIDEEEGSPAGTLLRFVNAVADAIAEEYPDVIVDTLAYKYTQTAPKITVPRDNVCVRLCSINCHFTQPLTSTASAENVKFCNDIVEWSKICDNIYIWDYTTNYTYPIATFPNFGVLRENMQFYADHNVHGMFPQGNGFSPSGEFGELRRYLLMRLMADPYMTEEEYYAHMDGFLEAYYGDGWRYIRAYIDKTTELASDTADMSGIYNTPFYAITRNEWTANRADFESYWNEALRLAGDRLENVQKSHMQWRFVKLCLTPNEAEARAVIADAEKWGMAFREGKPDVDPSSDLNTAPWNWKYGTFN